MVSELYSVLDLSAYAEQMRDSAAKSIKENYAENLDDYININQVYAIIYKEAVLLDEESRCVLDEEANERIYDSIRVWIHNTSLSKLAASDLVECAWDNKLNEMVFWTKETNKTPKKNLKNDKTKSNKQPKRKNT